MFTNREVLCLVVSVLKGVYVNILLRTYELVYVIVVPASTKIRLISLLSIYVLCDSLFLHLTNASCIQYGVRMIEWLREQWTVEIMVHLHLSIYPPATMELFCCGLTNVTFIDF